MAAPGCRPALLQPGPVSDAVGDDRTLLPAAQADGLVIEGNRGLYDGVDAAGAYSTAELAVSLGLPVLLVVDCTKSTRTVAALVLGCREMDRRVRLGGVVLNRLGSRRQESVIRQAVEQYTGILVLGAVQRQATDAFPQRHLGVTPHQEHEGARAAVDFLADLSEASLDLPAIRALMAPVQHGRLAATVPVSPAGARVRIGVLQDAAFQFYYPDNLEALAQEGADLVLINALTAPELPDLDGLYIGGGFPETSAAQLSANRGFLNSLRRAVAVGLPVYAECGGLIYLGESITLDGETFSLAGIFPARFGLEQRPQAHGYTNLQVTAANPFYPEGLTVKGHEFRYSRVLEWRGSESDLALRVERGVGFWAGRDGLRHNNVLALYTHVHALGTPEWAPGLATAARGFSRRGA